MFYINILANENIRNMIILVWRHVYSCDYNIIISIVYTKFYFSKLYFVGVSVRKKCSFRRATCQTTAFKYNILYIIYNMSYARGSLAISDFFYLLTVIVHYFILYTSIIYMASR